MVCSLSSSAGMNCHYADVEAFAMVMQLEELKTEKSTQRPMNLSERALRGKK
jgi:hypothetical protein